ncbi:MAG: hypothetical protein AAGC68_10295 [Verrucomicrobiota bacterium]
MKLKSWRTGVFGGIILVTGLASALSRAETPSTQGDPSTSTKPAAESDVADYIRYVAKESGEEALQTAVTRFSKGSVTVDLVSVVHIGDAAYFENLNHYFKQHELVLYEMVGGAYRPEPVEGVASSETGGLRQMQRMLTSFLGLEFQLDRIDYTAPNFVHADVTGEQFEELMAAKSQSFSTIITRAMELSESGGIPGLPQGEEAMGSMLGNLLTSFLSGDSNGLKRSLAPMLGESESLITQIEGDDGTVLVSERNKVVLQKLEEIVRAKGSGHYAIFYGAGHMPDFEKRLLADGYEKGESGWMDAWTIESGEASATEGADSIESGSPGAANPANPLEALIGIATSPEGGEGAIDPSGLLIQMFEDNPEVIGIFQQLGEVIEQMQGIE